MWEHFPGCQWHKGHGNVAQGSHGKPLAEASLWLESHPVGSPELQILCREFKFPGFSQLLFPAVLHKPYQKQPWCPWLCQYQWSAENWDPSSSAAQNPSHCLTFSSEFWPWPALPNNAEALSGVTVRPENIPRWWLWTRLPCFGKEREWSPARRMQNQAMHFLPSWSTVPGVQGFPQSELEFFWEFDCSQLLYIPCICLNACEIHGKF